MFYREGLLAPRPTPKLEDHPLSAVNDCLFNLFAATLHIGGRSSLRNLRTRHAVVTGTHYIESSRIDQLILNLGARWKWVVSFTSRPLYPRWPLISSLGGPQFQSRRFREETKHFAPRDYRNPDLPANSLIAIPAELFWRAVVNTALYIWSP
jgi:hypothetical protein